MKAKALLTRAITSTRSKPCASCVAEDDRDQARRDTEQFIAKQCKLYLKIEPDVLSKQHLKDLAKWVEVGAMRFLDDAKCKELAAKVALV